MSRLEKVWRVLEPTANYSINRVYFTSEQLAKKYVERFQCRGECFQINPVIVHDNLDAAFKQRYEFVVKSLTTSQRKALGLPEEN
jgi:hypothetical protein